MLSRSINTLGSISGRAIERTTNAPLFKNQPPKKNSSDAVVTSLSPPSRDSSRGEERALRNLSDASSFVSIASNATVQVEKLVERAQTIAQKLTTALSPDQQDALAEEGAAVLGEIDTIVSGATFQNSSVVNNGETSFSVNLDASDQSSGSTYHIQVQNVGISRANLGIDSLTSTDFKSNTSQTITTLENAQTQINGAKVHLADSEKQIANVGSQFGMVVEEQTSASRAAINPEATAEKIATLLEEKLAPVAHQLDSTRVTTLLTTFLEEEEKKESEPSSHLSPPNSLKEKDSEQTITELSQQDE